MMMGVGPVELLMILLGLGGGSLPLSLPPLPPDPVIARAAPDECLAHVALAGLAKPQAGAANHAEALLAEAEVQRFIGEVGGLIDKAMNLRGGGHDGQLSPAMRTLLLTLLTRPAALTVDSLTADDQGRAPVIEASLVVNCGPDAERVRAAFDALLAELRLAERGMPVEEFQAGGVKAARFGGMPPDAPDIAWAFKDGYFMAAAGTDALEHLLARLADEARRPPAWKTALEKRLPLERRSLLAHVDAAKAVEAVLSAGPPNPEQIRAVLEASGLGRLLAIQAVAGLTKDEIASATILDFEGEPTGFFAAGKAVAAADLKGLPADATMAQVMKIDLAAMLQTAFAFMDAVQAGSSAAPRQALEQVRAVAGVDVEKHVLEPLGDTWTVCMLPGAGALGVPRTAASVALDDPQTFSKTLAALTALAAKGAAQPGMPPLKFDRRQAGERTISTVRLADSQLEPAWCIDGDRLLVGESVATIEALIAQRAAARSLADVPAVAAEVGRRAAVLGYQEPKAAVALLQQMEAGIRGAVGDDMKAQGITLPRLPAADVVTRHLLPAVSVVRRDADGDILAEGRSTLPLGPLGGANVLASPATAGVGTALLLPSVQAARAAARRTVGMNNLRQLSLAMMIHENTSGSLPASAICDKDGKPLLSWRVAMLPYLEGQVLYEQFHLDEPWDSEHNKKLLENMPEVFASPNRDGKPGTTRYLVPTGAGTMFPAAAAGTKLADVADGLTNTILVVEAEPAKAVPWTKPEELTVNAEKPLTGLTHAEAEGFAVAFADGHVSWMPRDVAADVLKALFTPAGGEVVEEP